MNKRSLDELFDYTSYVSDQLKQVIPEQDLPRPAPGSGWPALRDCLGHIVLAYERWLPAITDLCVGDLPALKNDGFRTWADIDRHRSQVRNRLARALQDWSDDDLSAMYEVQVDGEILEYSRGELCTHLLLHECGHHGDVTTLLSQLGIDAETSLEYRFYLGREPRR